MIDNPIVALTNVTVIDGTGRPPAQNQTVVIDGALIQNVGPVARVTIPPNARVLDLRGRTVFPGLVGMHEHLYFTVHIDENGFPTHQEMRYSFPRLFLGTGVTTIRTAGANNPYSDLNLKNVIDSGSVPGPNVYLTGPLLARGGPMAFPDLRGEQRMREAVRYWAGLGFNWFKVYQQGTRAEVRAVIDEAHRHGAKVTGHLCATTFTEAIALGIDNLEHGFITDSEFLPDKRPDECPRNWVTAVLNAAPNAAQVNTLIELLVRRKVPLTSTLAAFAEYVFESPPPQARVLDAMTPTSRESCLRQRAGLGPGRAREIYDREVELERKFVAAGGLLISGSDPTANGCVVAGYATQRQVEALVEGGFSAVDAIRIATYNGALVLGIADQVGSIARGKRADLVIVTGNPASNIQDIRNVQYVFKDGIGYDPARLIADARGWVGAR